MANTYALKELPLNRGFIPSAKAYMLVIRRQQIDAFADHMRAQFLLRLSRYFLQHHPDVATSIPVEALLKKLSRSVAEAEKFGIEIENDVARFIELKFIRGWDFPTGVHDEEFSKILRGEEFDGTAKMDAIEAALIDVGPDQRA